MSGRLLHVKEFCPMTADSQSSAQLAHRSIALLNPFPQQLRTAESSEHLQEYQAPGEEKFVKYRPVAFKGRIFYLYDYRHTDRELFSTVAKTLAECRHRRDKWIEKKEQDNNR